MTGNQWEDKKIIYSGPWFPENIHGKRQRELNYSGELTIDPSQPNIVYFSHIVDGIFEISKGETYDFGKNWSFTPVTKNSEFDNARPFVPKYKDKNDPTVLLWMQNISYIHYIDYDSKILYAKFLIDQ